MAKIIFEEDKIVKIYVLSHEYCYGDYKYKHKEENRFKKIRGFSSHLDGFYIDKTKINQLGWVDGYRTGYFSMELGMHEEKGEE